MRLQTGIYVAIPMYLLFFDGFAHGNLLLDIQFDSFSVIVNKLPEFFKGIVLRISANLEAKENGRH